MGRCNPGPSGMTSGAAGRRQGSLHLSAWVADRSARLLGGLLRTLRRSRMAFAALLLVSGCIPIPVHRDVPSETQEEAAFTGAEGLRTAPFYHSSRVRKFEKALRAAGEDLVIMPSTELWPRMFPDRDPDAEATLGELLDPERRQRLQLLDVHCLILLQPLTEISHDEKSTFLGFFARDSKVETTRLAAIVADLTRGELLTQTRVTARGKSAATWAFVPLPMVSLFYLDAEADTEESAFAGLAQALATAIAEQYPDQTRRVVVMASVGQATVGARDAQPEIHGEETDETDR
jgi:hypothetical protein